MSRDVLIPSNAPSSSHHLLMAPASYYPVEIVPLMVAMTTSENKRKRDSCNAVDRICVRRPVADLHLLFTMKTGSAVLV
jgi:hypothetical protein